MMFWLKIAFVALLCLPILYLGFFFLSRILDQVIAGRPKDPEQKKPGRFSRKARHGEVAGVEAGQGSRPLSPSVRRGARTPPLGQTLAEDSERERAATHKAQKPGGKRKGRRAPTDGRKQDREEE